MQFFDLSIIAGFSIIIPLLIGVYKIKKIDTEYLPLILLLFTGLTNEVVSLYLIHQHGSNTINYNIYCLAEGLLILWLFKKWDLFKKDSIYYFLVILFITWWTAENILFSTLRKVNSYYIIFYSFLLILLNVEMIRKLLYHDSYRLMRHTKFITCTAFIIFFTYSMVLEIFWAFHHIEFPEFKQRLFDLFNYINLITNILIAIALLWAPSKPRYILEL